uniref:MFS transporter n=1 Tax=Streptomyces polyasparticus TaxID=2767826 RepID=UPI001BE409E6|nr:MFS transporter [Streptomyces polyasparticus]
MAGALSDRIGRRPTLLAFGTLAALLPMAMFGLMTQGHFAAALTGAIALACVAGGISAVAASAIAEQFPVAQRLSGLALGATAATAATAIFGGLTPRPDRNHRLGPHPRRPGRHCRPRHPAHPAQPPGNRTSSTHAPAPLRATPHAGTNLTESALTMKQTATDERCNTP